MLILKDPKGVLLRAVRISGHAALFVLRAAVSAEMLCLCLTVGGSVAMVLGVRLNFGDGWALIAASAPLFIAAVFLARGLSRV